MLVNIVIIGMVPFAIAVGVIMHLFSDQENT